jgi:iron complex outermembrane recepter protein
MKKVTLFMALILFCSWQFVLAQKTITGSVTDSRDGSTLPGVNVVVKGTTSGTTTDINGVYSIKVAANAQSLVFSFVGYVTSEIVIGNQTVIDVVMNPTSQQLEEVVVTALGQTKQQRALGYAQTTVKSKELIQAGSPNFGAALYGKVPGMTVNQAPGGATSGVAIQIRGINSISFKSTPLIVMDGVPVRDGTFDNSNYWNDQRIRANGLVDFNPEDIESISVLKGASAAALYGSEAVNGVILITTKSGKGAKGFAVDASVNYSVDKVAYLPQWQTVRGAGFNPGWGVYATDEAGFVQRDLNGTSYRALPQAGLNFGAEYDGQPLLYWDGQVRPYEYQDGGFANLFQTANNSTVNIAVSNNTDKSTSRFSYTFAHTEGLSYNSANDKHNFNLNNNFKFGKKVSTDILVNYMYWHIHNRPYMIDRMINNFGGMFPTSDNGDWYRSKYKTSLGYKYVTGSNQSLTPDENIIYPNFRGEIADYVWNVMENNLDEYNNRLNAVVKLNWEILTGLKFQARASTDFTSIRTQSQSTSSIPLAYGYSGEYSQGSNLQTILYGDLLLTYNKNITKDLDFTILGGYNARTETSFLTMSRTDGGLVTENKFDLSASKNTVVSSVNEYNQRYFVTDALFGTLNFGFKDYLFVEATLRRDRTSTMNPDNNTFVYPSVNSGFVFSDAFTMPKFISYGKLRASWGIVGNYPAQYIANPAYNPGNLGDQGNGTVQTTAIKNNPYGNSLIKPEQKNEWEIGLESRFLDNKLRLDIAYYSAKINDQILNMSLPSSSGANSVLTNVGSLTNKGVEVAFSATAISTNSFTWDIGLNLGHNVNKIISLTTGSNELLHANYDGDAAKLVSTVGQPMGDWYSHPIATDANGNYIIASDGTYTLDGQKWEKYGNAMEKMNGAFINTFNYKGFSLNALIDFKVGGYVMPTGLYWLTCRGLTEESLTNYNKENGGISYYLDADGKGVQTDATTGPNGETVYDDGMLLDGVLADGTTNTNVISQAIYYWYSYNWGGPQYGSSLYFKYINQNSYIKMRELSLAYNLPKNVSAKMHATNVQLSVYGRNLFYFYRTIKNMDSEQLSTGSAWNSRVNNAGTNPSSRSYGIMLRASF